MGAYPRDTGSNPVEGNGHFFPSYRQLYLSSFFDTHTHTHTHTQKKNTHTHKHTHTHTPIPGTCTKIPFLLSTPYTVSLGDKYISGGEVTMNKTLLFQETHGIGDLSGKRAQQNNRIGHRSLT